MHPSVSRAEYQVFQQLSQTATAQGMTTQDTIVLRMTKPDFVWFEKKKAIYLDGAPCHTKDRAVENDAEIDMLMERRGWNILRIRYDPPLTAKRLAEITQEITEFIVGAP
jgi:very-short-patch-repair endonuclease